MRKMKDSGIEWIGEIPEDWKLVKYKNFTINGMGNTILQTELVDEGIPVYSSTKDNKIFGYIKEPQIKLSKGDLVISARGTIGCSKLIKDELATCTQTTIYSHVHGINNLYLYYCTIGLKEYWFAFDKTAIPQITVRQVDNNIVPVPSIEEQELIADYLDNKVKEIDNIISKTKETIEEYKKYKQSVITEAVTKGLNPNVNMKDSVIEWIGKIPEDWGIVKVKQIFDIGRGRVISKLELDDDGKYPVYSSQTKNNGCLGYIKSFDYDTDQLTWTTDGANAGTIFLRKGKYNCTNVCGTLSPKHKYYNLNYLKYDLEYITFFHKRADTNGFKIMNNEMAEIKILYPSLEEQELIADYLDKKVKKIDNLISKKQELITQLEQYKKSLIYEYVTGKKEVSVSYAD